MPVAGYAGITKVKVVSKANGISSSASVSAQAVSLLLALDERQNATTASIVLDGLASGALLRAVPPQPYRLPKDQ